MKIDFNEFKEQLMALRPDAAEQPNGIISISLDSAPLVFVQAPDDPACLLMRTRVLRLSELTHAANFAKAALSGNFFWHATRGATLSAGPDNALYLTERRLLEEMSDRESLAAAIEDFTATVTDWQIRSNLYA